MSVLTTIKQWEKTLESGPRTNKLKIYCITFSLALIAGGFVAYSIRINQLQQIEKISQEIQQAEKTRMQKRVDTIREIKYLRGSSS